MDKNNLDLARATIRGSIWVYTSYYSGKILVFISTIVLARLLSQDDFGVAGYAFVTISFLEVFAGLGVGPALIYYPSDEEANNTAFWLNIMMGLVLLVSTWFLAPLVGNFFNDTRAVAVVRLLAINFPISAVGGIHDTLLRKQLSFSLKFIPDFSKALCKGIVSITLAAFGMGAWSLIIGQAVGTLIWVFVLWRVLPWRPTIRLSRQLVKPLLRYGLNIVAVGILGIFLENTDYLFIGRYMGAVALGIYSVAFRIPDILIMQFCSIISRVVFPVFSKMNKDAAALSSAFLNTTRYVSLITVPMGLGMAVIARPLVLVFFSEKWVEAYPVLQAIAIYGVCLSLAYNAGDIYKAQGKPKVLTIMAIFRVIILLPSLYWAATVLGTIAAVGWTHAVVAFIAGILALVVAVRMLNSSFSKVIISLSPAVLSGLLMCLCTWGVLKLLVDTLPVIQFGVGIFTGAIVYLGTLWLLHRDLVLETKNLVVSSLSRR